MRDGLRRRHRHRRGRDAEQHRVRAGAEAFHAEGDEVGVLLCHGFTGSPWSLRPLAADLAADGRTVAVPRLPGHGTHWRELNETVWTDWYACVEQEFNLLRRRCRQVFVVGLSMGGALALRIAERYGRDVTGLVLVNPAVHSTDRRLLALPLLRRVTSSMPAIGNDISRAGADEHGDPRTPLRALASMLGLWQDVRAELHRVRQPILLLRSEVDHVVDPSSARIISRGVSSPELVEVLLRRSFHVATLDHDAPEILARTRQFIATHRVERAPGSAGDGAPR